MYLNKPQIRPVAVAVLAIGMLTTDVSSALAQGARVGSTQWPQTVEGQRRFPAVAYDETTDAYLVAWGLSTVGARFVSASGVPLSARQTVSWVGGGATRVACGGGRCLIAWVEEPATIMGRLVQYNGGAVQFLTKPFTINSNGAHKLSSAAPAVAYSSLGGGEFLVAWTEYTPAIRITGQRVTVAGAAIGASITVAAWAGYQGFPSLTYNSSQHEYVAAYHAEVGGQNVVTTQRIKPQTGALLGSSSMQSGIFEQYPEIAYNSVDNQFLTITWHGGGGWMVHGQLADGNVKPIGSVLSLAAGGGGDGIGLAYNPVTNSYLAVFLSTSNEEIWGVVVSSTGVPGNQFQVTSSGASQAEFSTQPKAAASIKDGRWLTAASFGYKAIMSQLVQDGGGAPAAPVLVSPGGETTSTPSFTWRASKGATFYYLWVTDSTGRAKVQSWYTAAAAGCGAGTGTCSAAPGVALNVGSGAWWVLPWNESAGYGSWSNALWFRVVVPPPVAMEPSGTVSSAPILFKWSAVAGATMYYLWVNDRTGPRFQTWILASTACSGGGTTCAVNGTPELHAGTGFWWVEAWGPSIGYSPWSNRRSFTVAAVPAPTPLTPNGAVASSPILFSWTSVLGATMYYLWVTDSTGSGRIQQWLSADTAGCATGGSCAVNAHQSLNGGAGMWWVEAWRPVGGYSPWSVGQSFIR